MVFNLERKSTRVRSHFKGADTTLFKPFFCPTFRETLRDLREASRARALFVAKSVRDMKMSHRDKAESTAKGKDLTG